MDTDSMGRALARARVAAADCLRKWLSRCKKRCVALPICVHLCPSVVLLNSPPLGAGWRVGLRLGLRDDLAEEGVAAFFELGVAKIGEGFGDGPRALAEPLADGGF